MTVSYWVACAALLGTWLADGRRGRLSRLLPLAVVFGLTLGAGLVYATCATLSFGLWLVALGRLRVLHRRESLADACQEPLQAMFEQASLLGNAEHCAVAATHACPAALQPIWQLAIADWARGSSADEAFARVGAQHSLRPLERLARALALTRHTGTPLARHLAVLLEDVAEDLRLRREARTAIWPYALATALLAAVVLVEVVWLGLNGGGPVPALALVAAVSAGGAPLLAVEVAR